LSQTAIIGLQPRGIFPAKRIHSILCERNQISIPYGELDSTFYRDDFRRTLKPLVPSSIHLEFNVEEKNVILIDDVLYTGRSVRSALNALGDFGRPARTELLVMIDRRYNRELPIQPDYCGEIIDSRMNDKVLVQWGSAAEDKEVWILTQEEA
jgi:pyrimidine operon attenuation protein/uracil phosphoribosyltransferase